ncbi:golgin subfamily A member 6-like protein 2 isoform X2 [Electrophorus electricus]|uniref:golgin subfamily A member 6-like protein 2 isoform X2 n=1 Tax=Electrophorus electricus TaxID=8005 RepID=UPI0015D0C340|nr:golgin subfamily A member 6-like protein 2 isoform X2 [Electrophorus electricus]
MELYEVSKDVNSIYDAWPFLGNQPDLLRLLSSRPMRSYMVVVFLTTLWIFIGVGCLPVMNIKNSNCLEDASMRANANLPLPGCDGQVRDKVLTAEQRHEGLLRELQDLAEPERQRERHYARETRDFDKSDTDDENNLQSKVDETEGRTTKEEDDGWAWGQEGMQNRDEARMKEEKRGAKQTKRELEELLAKEIQKKENSKRHSGELEEENLREEPKEKQYEAAKKMEHWKSVRRAQEVVKEEEGEKGEMEEEKKRADEKHEEAKKSEKDKREGTKMERRNEVRENVAELLAEKERVEQELEALMWQEQEGGMKVVDKEKQREEKEEELQELLRKMKIVQEERRIVIEDTVGRDQEVMTEQETEGDKDGKSKKDGGGRVVEGDNRELKKQKREMEKASDERTRQFESERHTDTEQEEGKVEEEEQLRVEDLTEIEAKLRRVVAELKELRRG